MWRKKVRMGKVGKSEDYLSFITEDYTRRRQQYAKKLERREISEKTYNQLMDLLELEVLISEETGLY
jgi:hypothetical protein